jgi:hypothetical protein
MLQRILSIAVCSTLILAAAGRAQAPFVRTVIVDGGSTPTANGAALISSLAGITGNSSTNPWLVKVEPGIFDLGSASLAMRDYIDIEGSGRGVTIITSTAPRGGTNNGVINIASGIHNEVRDLTVQNTATSGDSICITNISSNFSLNRVNLINTGDSSNNFGLLTEASNPLINEVGVQVTSQADGLGIWVTNGAPVIRDATINLTASGAAASLAGVIEMSGGSVVVDRATITLSGGLISDGFYIVSSTPTISRCTVNVTGATGGTSSAEGIRVANSAATLQDNLVAVTAANINYGIVLDGDTGNVLRSVVNVSGSSATQNNGIYIDDLTTVTLSQVQVTATGGSQTSAVFADYGNGSSSGETLTIFDSNLLATGATNNYGINVSGASNTFNFVGTTATGATGTSYGLTESNSSNTFRLDHCQITGATGSVHLFDIFSAGASQLNGAVAPAPGVCAASYDGTYTARPTNCL